MLLKLIPRRHVSSAQWDMMLQCRDKFAHVVGGDSSSTSKALVLSWNQKTDKPDGKFVVALGGQRVRAGVVHILWVGLGVGNRWVPLVTEAASLVMGSRELKAVQLNVPTDTVQMLHRAGFRLGRVQKSHRLKVMEPASTLALMRRLPRQPRLHHELPCVTDIDSLLFADHLMKQRLVREVDSLVPMYLHMKRKAK
jgi:hypothetical protein